MSSVPESGNPNFTHPEGLNHSVADLLEELSCPAPDTWEINYPIRDAFRRSTLRTIQSWLGSDLGRSSGIVACRAEMDETTMRILISIDEHTDARKAARLVGKIQNLLSVSAVGLAREGHPANVSSQWAPLREAQTYEFQVVTNLSRSESKNDGARGHLSPSSAKFGSSVPALTDELRRSLPLAVEAHNIAFYQVRFKAGDGQVRVFPFFVLKAFVPDEELEDFFSARSRFEHKHSVTVFPQIVPDSPGVKNELKALLGPGETFLTEDARLRIKRELLKPKDIPPQSPNYSPEDLKGVVNLTAEQTVTIDPAVTSSKEDAFSVRVLEERVVENGVERVKRNILLSCSIVSAVPFAPPGSEAEREARERVFPLFGKDISKPILDRDVTKKYASFRKGKEKIAFTISCLLPEDGPPRFYYVTSEGGLKATENPVPYMSLLKVTEEFTPEEFARVVADDAEGDSAAAVLVDAVRRLNRSGLLRGDIRRLDGQSVGDIVVSDLMVFVKKAFGDFLRDSQRPTLFRNQAAPSRETLCAIVKRCREAGIEAEVGDFEEPQRLFALCYCLNEEHHLPLLSDILEVFFGGSRVGFESKGHYALRAANYCEVKPHKGYYGLYNQYVLSSILRGTPLPVADDDQKALRELEEDVNAKLDTRDMLAFRFRQLASIYHQLADVGKEYDAIVTRIRDDEVLFDVPGFSKWGQLRSGDDGMQGSLSAALIEGHDVLTEGSSVVRVRLMGFDPEKMRFVFAPVTVH